MYLHGKKVFVLLAIVSLTCLSGCVSKETSHENNEFKSNSSIILTQSNTDITYDDVINSISAKIEGIEQKFDMPLWTYFDIEKDGINELFLLYEYPEDNLTYEVWTVINNSAVQIAVASDLASLPGNGFGGINLASYDNDNYLCFWSKNNETDPPGVDVEFNFSLWRITKDGLKNPIRFGFIYHIEENITQIHTHYGPLFPNNFSVDQCKSIIDAFYTNPIERICQIASAD